MTAPLNAKRKPPYKRAALALILLTSVVLALGYMQFRGDAPWIPRGKLAVLAARAGLSMDPGTKVTYNGVPVGRVATVEVVAVGGDPKAKITLDVDPKYLKLIPQNVDADITASTVFGNKYVALSSPRDPSPHSITSSDVIDVTSVTTEFNTLFETVTQIAEKVDPVKLNMTLTATADALSGLGNKLGKSLVDTNKVLAELNPRMPRIRHDTQLLANLSEVYANAAPDLFDGLTNAVRTARTFSEHQRNLDEALMAAMGFASSGSDVLERGGPYLARGAADLVPTAQLLDTYSPEIFCTIRNFNQLAPQISDALGSNGYAVRTATELLGAANPYVYPDNLPRVNAKGGPGGRPGCWQPITRDLWPAPYLVMDTGASIAPYNHFELGQPILNEYVWGRQIGENTINP
jgi:phospholipid/cholesterol/gamma-HCH transport system substrate-binding protein